MISDNTRVNSFIEDLQLVSADKYNIIQGIRKIFLKANKNITEDIKYGGIVFNLSDKLIGGVFCYKKHISIEFSEGADFPDSSKVLEGKGKRRRHIKIIQASDIETKQVVLFITEAVRPAW